MTELPNTNRSLKTTLIAAVVAVAVAGTAYWFIAGSSPMDSDTPTAEDASAIATGDVQVGASPYTLVDMNGSPLTEKSFADKYKIVFFGFSNCQDECPIGLHNMADALGKLGADAAKVQMIFITVDPARDTADVLKKYLANFDARILGATGTPEQIKAATYSFRAYASDGTDNGDAEAGEHKHVDDGKGDPALVNHSDSIYFLSPQNGLLNLFNGDVDGATLANDIQTVLAAAMIPSGSNTTQPPADNNDAVTLPPPPVESEKPAQ